LDIPIIIYASIDNDIYRKPHTTFYDIIKLDNEYEIKEVFYCGDACGRKSDHSDTDYKFALNCGITFYTPEELFSGRRQEKFIKYPLDFNKKYITNDNIKINYDNNKTLIVMCGFPGSGKSTYVKANLKKFVRVNQDTLKTKDKCVKVCKENMEKNKNIVIDNTNASTEIRKLYLDLADEYEYKKICIKIETPREIAKHNMYYRFYKANKIKSDNESDEESDEKKKVKYIPEIAYNKYAKDFKEPTKKEFDEIYIIKQNYPEDSDYFKYYF
jgi:bifunctional polynucleotide phosphatase/kinase